MGAALLLLGGVPALADPDDPFTARQPPPVVGRWDLKVHGPEGDYPSWLEVRQSGFRTLVGSFVGRFGSARPVARVDYDRGRVRFTLPPQWERRTDDLTFEGKLEDDVLRGETTDDKGKRITWEGRRAPSLKRDRPPRWGEPVELFNGRDLSGWKPRSSEVKNGWLVRDGLLTNATPGNDLLTERQFTDFKLYAEFRYPKGSNSGVYLRGRYEMQVEYETSKEDDYHCMGAIYGMVPVSPRIEGKPGTWESFDITFVGRKVTIERNGVKIIDNKEIAGITGGALDSNEGEPGPFYIQGDHTGGMRYRNILISVPKK